MAVIPKKETIQKQRKIKEKVLKLLNNSSSLTQEQLYYEFKMLEFVEIKTFEAAKIAVRVIRDEVNKRLNNSKLTNKQKQEILLVAQLEAFKIIDVLIKPIEKLEG